MMNSPGFGLSPPEEAMAVLVRPKPNTRAKTLKENRMLPLFGSVLFTIAVANLGAKIATAFLLCGPFRHEGRRSIKCPSLVKLRGASILPPKQL